MPEPHLLAFVDSIAANPTVRLDLSGGVRGPFNLREGSRFDPPPMKRSVPSSYMIDGGTPNAASYDNRTIELKLQVMERGVLTTPDTAASYIQLLQRELDRPTNILRYQAGTSSPVFFKTFRAGPEQVEFHPTNRELTISLLAEPFALGLRETLSPVVVGNDPAEGPTLNANPNFETDASNWTVNGGSSTIARSTTQALNGVASLLLTPDGVTASVDARSENVAATVGTVYRASAWVRCAVARTIGININWRNSGAGLLSTSTNSVAVSATTWTLISVEATAPASTAFAQMTVSMGSTPAGSNTLHIDEARVRATGVGGGMAFDISSPKGDIETPLHLEVEGTNGVTGRLQSGIAIRRRGTPSAAPIVLQAEAMTQGTNTTTQANSTSFSGTGNNYSRCTFGTTTMTTRLSIAKHPTSGSVDARGTYRVFLRLKKNTGADVINVRLQWGGTGNTFSNGSVSAGTDTNHKYVDLGLVQIPAGYDPVTDGDGGAELPTEGIAMSVQAERSSGSGTLDMDLLLLMPCEDRLMFVRYPGTQNNTSDVFVVEGGSRPAVYCLTSGGQLTSTEPAEISGTGLMLTPGRTNRVFYARDLGTGAAAASGDSLTTGTTITPFYYPRYLSPVRPATS